jgi:metal-responsive CopG/Arc/MetJ family transcriptional regulator
MAYHMLMARREVLVQLDDQLVADLDRLADRLGTSRSDLLRRAAQAVIEAEQLADDDAQLVRAYSERPPDPLLVQSARRLAARTAPAW